MNLLSSLQSTEVVDGEWTISHLIMVDVVVLVNVFNNKAVRFCFSCCSKWEVASTASQSRKQWKCKIVFIDTL